MINPILIIAAAAVFLSAVVVAVLNKPRFPLIAGSLILILIFFVLSTYMLDSAIGSYSSADGASGFLNFLVLGSDLSYAKLEEVFTAFEITDISLFAASLVSMFLEALYILRKNSDV